jgi:histone acetyltransferase HTATIP
MADKIVAGCKLQVLKRMEEEEFWREAEVISMRVNGATAAMEFYVHYTNFNKRLDEWVTVDRMKLDTISYPKPEKPPAPKKKKISKKESLSASVNSATAGAAMSVGDDVDNADDTAGRATPEPLATSSRSKEEEIEALRRGGSMTQRPEEVHRMKNINSITIGQYQVETWYFSPYPEIFSFLDTMYICEFCLLYFDSKTRFARHRQKCTLFHPPGTEIYRDTTANTASATANKDMPSDVISYGVSFWEIDGHRQRTWCRNLCLLSKLFLDHKTLYYDVNPFLFYVMTQNDSRGCHIVGYFSKEKESLDGYNVACILTLPHHQRKGYGRLLIQFSYELSKIEGKVGSPEKPLSDLGLLSYRSFWAEVLLTLFYEHMRPEDREGLSIDKISEITAMTNDDILHTLQWLDVLRYVNGQYIVVLKQTHEEQYKKMKKKNRVSIDPAKLDWRPPVFSASQLRYI